MAQWMSRGKKKKKFGIDIRSFVWDDVAREAGDVWCVLCVCCDMHYRNRKEQVEQSKELNQEASLASGDQDIGSSSPILSLLLTGTTRRWEKLLSPMLFVLFVSLPDGDDWMKRTNTSSPWRVVHHPFPYWLVVSDDRWCRPRISSPSRTRSKLGGGRMRKTRRKPSWDILLHFRQHT